jgi:DNA-binding NtrC family response regulator
MNSEKKLVTLIIDDDELFCEAVTEHLEDEGFEVLSAHRGFDGLKLCSEHRVDVVLLDENLPDIKGHALCPSIREASERCKIVFVTAQPSFNVAVKALRAGADDYLSKPVELEQVSLIVSRAARIIALERDAGVARFQGERESKRAALVGVSPAFEQQQIFVELAGQVDATVLLTGETGTGKSVTARAIHYRSERAGRSFLEVNCAALPENLIESELFGHSKGSFTGASTNRRGLFEVADGGTLLLDEIGEMPVNLQTKLLSVLEDGRFRRVGSESEQKTDVRVIAATNQPLENLVGGALRSDLYYRLSVLRFEVPPLRARPEDIGPFCAHILASFGKDLRLGEGELERLSRYDWPGNVRELRNVLERAAILQTGPTIYPSRVLMSADTQPWSEPPETESVESRGGVETLGEIERQHILRALDVYEWNYSQTARALGIALSTLKRKLKSFGLHKSKGRAGHDNGAMSSGTGPMEVGDTPFEA